MTDEEILRVANEIVSPHGLQAELLETEAGPIRSVGVQGDNRTYQPVVLLVGRHPGNDVLRDLSTRITNETPASRVTIEIGRGQK